MNNVTGSGYPVSPLASNLKYRAWGSLKSETFGNGLSESAGYNARLQLTSFEVRKGNNDLAMSNNHQYYADGTLKFSNNALDERFDRAYAFDHALRVKEAYSGSEARDFNNGTTGSTPTGPYRQSYQQYDAFNHVLQQTNRMWSMAETTTHTFSNNRKQGWEYTATGQVQHDGLTGYLYDAAGRLVQATSETASSENKYDGDGKLVWTSKTTQGRNGSQRVRNVFYLGSSVFGGAAVAELGSVGQKNKNIIYAGGRKLAEVGWSIVNWTY